MWKCSTTCESGWEQPGFDDSAWPVSTDAGINGVDPVNDPHNHALHAHPSFMTFRSTACSVHGTDRGIAVVLQWGIREVSPDAHWIWSQGTGVAEWQNGDPADTTDDNHACCRFTSDHVPINCNAARQRYVADYPDVQISNQYSYRCVLGPSKTARLPPSMSAIPTAAC